MSSSPTEQETGAYHSTGKEPGLSDHLREHCTMIHVRYMPSQIEAPQYGESFKVK